LHKPAESVTAFLAAFLECHWSLQCSRNHWIDSGHCLNA